MTASAICILNLKSLLDFIFGGEAGVGGGGGGIFSKRPINNLMIHSGTREFPLDELFN